LILEEQLRAKDFTKEALLQVWIWRHQSLKTIRSWLSDSDHEDPSESEVKNLKLVKWTFEDTNMQKEYKTEATTISKKLEGIGCLPTKKW